MKRRRRQPREPKPVFEVKVPVAYTEYTLRGYRKLRDVNENKKGRKRRLCGQALYGDRLLHVDTNMLFDATIETTWHEWFHAVFKQLGYDKSAKNEAMVESLAQAVTRVMFDRKARIYFMPEYD